MRASGRTCVVSRNAPFGFVTSAGVNKRREITSAGTSFLGVSGSVARDLPRAAEDVAEGSREVEGGGVCLRRDGGA